MNADGLFAFFGPVANDFNRKAKGKAKSNSFPQRSIGNKSFDHHDEAE